MKILRVVRNVARSVMDFPAEFVASKRWELLSEKLLDLASANDLIAEVITNQCQFLVGRPGGTEGRLVEEFIRRRWGTSRLWSDSRYSSWARRRGPEWSGIVGDGATDFDVFVAVYLRSILASDALFLSNVAPSVHSWARVLSASGVPISDLANLNPYRALKFGLEPWTKALEGKKVLILHPFEDSIRSQFARRGKITGVNQILPDFQLDVLKPPVTFAGENESAKWFQQFACTASQLRSRDFDVMIAGAGAYGLPLSQVARDMGKTAIHLGGQVQVLFGIRGKRFGDTSSIAAVMDSTWISPSRGETPEEAHRV